MSDVHMPIIKKGQILQHEILRALKNPHLTFQKAQGQDVET